MAAIGSVTVYDGAATPVAHVLSPESVSRVSPTKVLASWRESSSTVPTVAQTRMTASIEKLPSGVYRVERVIEIPVMEAVAGQNAAGYTAAPKVAHVLKDIRVLFAHERSDVTQRRLIRQMGVNIDGGVTASVTANTVGWVSDLFDQLLTPT